MSIESRVTRLEQLAGGKPEDCPGGPTVIRTVLRGHRFGFLDP